MQVNLHRGLRLFEDKGMLTPIDDGFDFGDIPLGDMITHTAYLGNNSHVSIKNIKHESKGYYKISSHPTSLDPFQSEPITIIFNSSGLFGMKKIESEIIFTGDVA